MLRRRFAIANTLFACSVRNSRVGYVKPELQFSPVQGLGYVRHASSVPKQSCLKILGSAAKRTGSQATVVGHQRLGSTSLHQVLTSTSFIAPKQPISPSDKPPPPSSIPQQISSAYSTSTYIHSTTSPPSPFLPSTPHVLLRTNGDTPTQVVIHIRGGIYAKPRTPSGVEKAAKWYT